MTRTTPRSSPEHEARCERCGTSCMFAFEVEDVSVAVRELRCRFLEPDGDGPIRDAEAWRCSVYAHRLEQAPWCRTVPEALEDGLLRSDCPYTRGVPGYGPRGDRGKRRLSAQGRSELLPLLRAALVEHGAPVGSSHDGLRELIAQTGGGEFDFEDTDEGVVLVPVTKGG